MGGRKRVQLGCGEIIKLGAWEEKHREYDKIFGWYVLPSSNCVYLLTYDSQDQCAIIPILYSKGIRLGDMKKG